MFLSVITLAELRYEVERLAAGRRKRQLSAWLEGELPVRFEHRVLPVDADVADRGGLLMARSELGMKAGGGGRLYCGDCSNSHLTLVTRNVTDFREIVSDLLNPWA